MKIGLAFSGGKDSWACLWLNRHRLHEITVLWVNTGKNYPELLASIEKARAMCPNFVEITVDRDAQNKEAGIPSDVVPVFWTRIGQSINGPKPTLVQGTLDCCYANISAPLHKTIAELGLTHVIRGQRRDETYTTPARDGDKVFGVTFWHPLENWSAEQVLSFVASNMPLPNHFKFKHSSMDCYDCTGFRDVTQDRVEYTRLHHPQFHAEYSQRAGAIKHAIAMAIGE